MNAGCEKIDWESLSHEFERFETDAEFCRFESADFVRSLAEPLPEFVKRLLEKAERADRTREETVRALYCFLLKKRYEEKINLLHFAFNIFDDDTTLPDEVVGCTLFPHEDGEPKFKYIHDDDFKNKL